MKAYCINLDSRPDRLEYVTDLFGRLGMVFERISAVDGKDPGISAAARALAPMWTGCRMSSGAYACLQSHRKIWQRLLDSGDHYAMIFEDDMFLANGIATYLHDAWIPQDADVVKLETFGTRAHLDRTTIKIIGGRSLRRLRSRHVGSGAYVVSAAAARRLLIQTESGSTPIDEVLFNDTLSVFADLTVYQMLPAPAIQGKRVEGSVASPAAALNWIKASIEPVSKNSGPRSETVLRRLWRRTCAEAQARTKGTIYVVVPHG
ncbi:glycosyltransferase family 25 protein [Marinobacter salicampi]|uniref:glycosyltransferase family 25 protein n=1 Tax=Marinobacter salicampi TaxID=435907 RepID=UPI0014098D49|nr:glycosyltransferase family 25 protein [Marinobacter salicampi]